VKNTIIKQEILHTNVVTTRHSIEKDVPRIRLQIAVLATRILLNEPRMCTLLKQNTCSVVEKY